LVAQYPLFREVVVATVALGALLANSSMSKTQLAIGYSAFLFLLPNGFSFLPGKRLPAKLKKAPSPQCAVDTPFSQVLKTKCGQPTGERYVVIGGGGFVGERIIHALLLRGETNIVCLDLAVKPITKKELAGKVTFVIGNATDKRVLEAVLQKGDVVFSTVAVIRFYEWLPKHLKRSSVVNVDGTQAIVDTCSEMGVKRLIVTGTANAVFSCELGPTDLDERAPLATASNATSNYVVTKSIAERIVLGANGRNGLATGIIRPVSPIKKQSRMSLKRTDSSTLQIDIPGHWISR